MANKNEILLASWASLFEAHPIAIKNVMQLIEGKSPLGLDEYDFLLILSREPGHKSRLSVLSEKTLYTRSGISRVSKRMTEKGFIKVQRCTEDKRGFWATLTPKGVQALKSSWTHYSQAIIETLGPCLDMEEAKTLSQLLMKIIAHHREEKLVQIGENRIQK